MNINLTLYNQIAKYSSSEEIALYFRNRKVSFKELIKRIDLRASQLYYLGIRKDEVVILLSPNVIDTVITLYALNKIGAIVSILHPLVSQNELIRNIELTKAKNLFILDARYYEYKNVLKKYDINTYFLSARDDLNIIEKIGFHFLFLSKNKYIDNKKLLSKIKFEKQEFEINADYLKPSIYLQSGGTTGKSKTIILNDQNISYPGSQSFNILGREIKGISMIGLLPFYHGFGISMGLHAPLMNEAASSLMIKYNGKEICRKIKKNQLNVLIVIPYLAKKLLKEKSFNGKKLQNLYATYIGADKSDTDLYKRFDDLMIKNNSNNRLLQGYGLSECVAVNFVNTFSNNKIGSVGKPLNDVNYLITKLDNFELVKKGETGRLLISSPSMCLGYLDKDKNDSLFKIINNKKYLVTGDLAYVDEEGYLFIKGRNVDVIKIAGYNVFPYLIEEKTNSIDEIKDSCALFIDNEKHPFIALFVVRNSDISQKAIYNILKEDLLQYSLPEKIIFIDKFPLTNIGKIDKNKLKEMVI